MLKDVFKHTVNEGDEVVLLVKIYGYRKISDAYLAHVFYIGKGPYGHEFIDKSDYKKYLKDPDWVDPFRCKQPECVKIIRNSK